MTSTLILTMPQFPFLRTLLFSLLILLIDIKLIGCTLSKDSNSSSESLTLNRGNGVKVNWEDFWVVSDDDFPNPTVGAFAGTKIKTGVVFSAYVHNDVNGDALMDDWTSYSLEDVKTMMRVISKRFSKIITTTVGAVMGPYQKNYTYYQSFSQVYAAEAAALVNHEMFGTPGYTPLSMYVGVRMHTQLKLLHLEINLAMESSEKANNIFPGTVLGIVFNGNDIHSDLLVASLTLQKLQNLRRSATELGLRLGTRQSCTCIGPQDNTPLNRLRKEIVEASDFIICEFTFVDGPTPQTFADTVDEFTIYENHARLINPVIEIMGQTGWPARANNMTELAAMRHYWRKANTLAENFKIDIWMMEAFDSKWKVGDGANMGWWKLTDNSKTNQMDGYAEKVEVLKSFEQFTINSRQTFDYIINRGQRRDIVNIWITTYVMISFRLLH